MFEQKVNEFVGYQLQPHLGNMLDQIPKMEKDPPKANKEMLEKLAFDFNNNWKNAIEALNADLSKTFPNFRNGARVLQAVLTQFVLLYKRFITIWDAALKSQKTKVVPVGMQTVLVEIKKYRSTFA